MTLLLPHSDNDSLDVDHDTVCVLGDFNLKLPEESRRPLFARYIGIDYSGAKTPEAGLTGLRVYVADQFTAPQEEHPMGPASKYWSRRGIAQWLTQMLGQGIPTVVGIDHAFSFPLRYFEENAVPKDWSVFLEDFERHWPTANAGVSVDMVRSGAIGTGSRRVGQSTWRRLTDIRARAKSAFHFDVPGSVAKSTHGGLPWLLSLKRRFGNQVHFWPFDGWQIPSGRDVVLEAYPSLWNRDHPVQGRTPDQHDAYCVAASLRDMDMRGTLARSFEPSISPARRDVARMEGWILGVE